MTEIEVLALAIKAGFHFHTIPEHAPTQHTNPLEYSEKCFHRFAAALRTAWEKELEGQEPVGYIAANCEMQYTDAGMDLPLGAPLYTRPLPLPGWRPIETAPKGGIGYAWMRLAWDTDEGPQTADGIRCGDKFFVAPAFYSMGKEKRFELREIEIRPTHWMPLPEAPKEKA